MPTRFSKLAKILPPGMYAKLFEKELAEKAAQEAAAWKPGELYRTVSEPKITDINPEFRDTYIENLKREAAAKPTPENQQRLQTAIDDLLPKLESAPKSPEELAAARRLEEFASESKPKVLTREQMGQKRELDKIIEEINADKSSAEKTKLMEPSSEASTKILPVLGLTGAAALASSLDPDEAEAGVKGSLAPRKELADKFKKTINNWVIGGTNDQRNILSNMLDEDQTGLVRKEMLRRLSKEGKIQFNPEFNEHSIRLYRGDNEDFFNKGLYKTQSTSWTPDLGVANFFREGAGNTYQTDLPISKIGAYLNSLPGERAFRKEKEVIVKPFEGKVEKKSIFDDDDNSASNLLELINKRINQETPISDLTEKTYGIRSDVAKKKELAKDYAKLTNQGHKFLNKNIPNITKDLSNEDVLNFIQKTGFSTNLLENLANLPYHQSDYLSPEHKAFLKEKASEIQTPSDFILNNIAKKKQLDDPAQKNTEKMRLVNQIDNLYYSGVINKDEYKSLQNKTITEFRGNEYGDLNDMVNTYKTYLENFKNEGTDKLEPYFRKQSLENYLENMYVDRVITKDEHDILKDVLNKHFNEFNKEEPSSPYFSPELLGIAGAGALASSSSAEAADAIPISRSNPEYTSSATSKNVKQAAAEEQDKSNVIKSLEGLGVYGRSLFDSGTLGISDVGVSSVAGLLNALATSNEQAPFSERFKRGYAEDKAYYEKIKKSKFITI